MMTIREIVEKARRSKALGQKRLSDPRTRKVLGFLVAKRLLFAPGITPLPRVRLSLDDVHYVARYIEPRVNDVLPEALLRFPKSFYQKRYPARKLNKSQPCAQRKYRLKSDT